MNILLINKFLHPSGGAETYVFRLGSALESLGHRVEYFGMDHPDRLVGNRIGAYTRQMDFHSGSQLRKLGYPFRILYSPQARRALRRVLEDLQPDVCLLNNFNYQLTPSILVELRAWQRRTGRRCPVLYTAHDYQLVCPNHMCRNPVTGENCGKCLDGNFLPCIRGRCIHGSLGRSILGAAESFLWHGLGIYRELDAIVCCSRFLKERLDRNPVLREKTLLCPNFAAQEDPGTPEKEDYVLYFGRLTPEKGIEDLLLAANALPQISFRLAGAGPLAARAEALPNVTCLGFLTGEALKQQIRRARLTVYPSRWYENCPFSVMESIRLGTPVLGADIGGIPELIAGDVTGCLFESGNADALTATLETLWRSPDRLARMAENCRHAAFDTPEGYAQTLLDRIARMQMEVRP